MNILFCGDENIADGVIISMLSLLEHAKDTLNIYLLTATVENEDRQFKSLSVKFADFLDGVVKKHNAANTVKLFDISELFSKELPVANMDTRFTPCCMLRLFADLVDELPQKILYLDNDIICQSDPSDFYNTDLQGAELAGCLDYYGSWLFKKSPLGRDYLNSGVLLLDLCKIKETGLFENCRKRCRNTKMFMPDQSSINKLTKKKLIIPRKYNEQRRLHKDTVFRHFTTSFRVFPWIHTVSVKPWDIDGMHKILKTTEYDSLLQNYLSLKQDYLGE